jgi:thioredoxin reductase (NADPH)
VTADALIIATGAVAKRLEFPGAGEGPGGYWNKGISACAVCDGAAPIFRNRPLAVIGGGDSAMEEANFLTKYGSKVYIVHRRGDFRASKIMAQRALDNPKIEVLWHACVDAALGDGATLKSLRIKNLQTGALSEVECAGLFFAIGHEPASKFLEGQLALDEDGYIATKPGTADTSVAVRCKRKRKHRKEMHASDASARLLACRLGRVCGGRCAGQEVAAGHHRRRLGASCARVV